MTGAEISVAATVVLLREGRRGPEVLMLRRPDRGNFAGAWVFPGGKIDPADIAIAGPEASEDEIARIAGVRETAEETGLRLDGGELLTLSCWIPPAQVQPRFRTWFFLAPFPGGQIVPQPAEVEEHLWLRPAEALQQHSRAEMTLVPVTWVTLLQMSTQPDVASVLAEAREIGIQRFESRLREDDSMLLWPEDSEYGEGRTGSGRHRLDRSALPWVYTREI